MNQTVLIEKTYELKETYYKIIQREAPQQINIVKNTYREIGVKEPLKINELMEYNTLSQIKIKFFAELIISNKFQYKNYDIKISDNVWDFNHMNKARDNRKGYKVTFDSHGKMNPEDLLLIKLFVINGLVNERFKATINDNAHYVELFCNKVQQEGGSIFYVTDAQIMEYALSIDRKYRHVVLKFISFLSELFDKKLISNQTLDEIKGLSKKKTPAEIEASKTPLIPTVYYEKVSNHFHELFFEISPDSDDYWKCGGLCIQIKTGLRLSEIARLKKDCILIIEGTKNGAFLKYHNTKNQHGNVRECLIPITGKTLEIIHQLQKHSETEQLLSPNASSTVLRTYYHRIMRNSVESLDLKRDYDGVPKKGGISVAKTTHYRVYCQTQKAILGVPPRIITQMYGQTSEIMEGYYVRALHQQQEDKGRIVELAQTVINNKMLGPKSTIREGQLETVQKASGKTVKDVMDYAEMIGDEFEIKKKNLGYCIKSKGRTCEKDQETDSYDCAFGICSNGIHFYFMLTYSYEEFKKTLITYNNALEAGHDIIAQTEARKILYRLKQYVEPEFEEFKKRLSEEGADSIISQHPDLEPYVKRINEIQEEITEWKTICSNTINHEK